MSDDLNREALEAAKRAGVDALSEPGAAVTVNLDAAIKSYLSAARSPRDPEAAEQAIAQAVGVYSEAAPSVLAKAALEAALPLLGLADGPEPEGLTAEECEALVKSLRWLDAKALNVDTPVETWTLAAIRDKTEARLAKLSRGTAGG